jgi:hypothetical protein
MTSGSSAILNDVYFVDELRGWAVGIQNTILATTSPLDEGALHTISH